MVAFYIYLFLITVYLQVTLLDIYSLLENGKSDWEDKGLIPDLNFSNVSENCFVGIGQEIQEIGILPKETGWDQ